MQSQTTVTLTTVLSDVLKDLAFMFVDGDPAEVSPDATWLETTIGYCGPESGTLTLQCTTEFGILLAANLLGIDPDDDDAEVRAHDAVKEFMNIVCGQFVTTAFGTDHVFNLTIPASRILDEMPDFTRGDDESTSTLNVEGHVVRSLFVSGKCPEQPQDN